MAAYGDCRTIEVDAPPERCFALMTDYERMPSWQGAVRSIRVEERDEQGRGSVVSYGPHTRRDRGRGDEARAARPRTRGREAWRFRLLIRPPPPS